MITKKQLKREINRLSKRIDKIYNFDAVANVKDLCKLREQVECSIHIKIDGTQGHNFKFVEYGHTQQGIGPYNDNLGSILSGHVCFNWAQKVDRNVGRFKCEFCGINMYRKLTPAEKKAVKKLGL